MVLKPHPARRLDRVYVKVGLERQRMPLLVDCCKKIVTAVAGHRGDAEDADARQDRV